MVPGHPGLSDYMQCCKASPVLVLPMLDPEAVTTDQHHLVQTEKESLLPGREEWGTSH